MNRVTLVGRITQNPELKYTSTNVPVVSFTLAVNRTFLNQQGERDADFIYCVVWRNQAENVAKYMKKGSLIGVDGRIQSRNYETTAGEKRTIIEVVCENVHFLEPKSTQQQQPEPQDYHPEVFDEDESPFEISFDDDDDTIDDLPF